MNQYAKSEVIFERSLRGLELTDCLDIHTLELPKVRSFER